MADTLTVIVARPLPNADGVVSVARAWSKLGLLDPMLWVDPVDGSGTFRSELIIRGESTRSLLLSAALASAPYGRVKLLSVRLATSEGAFDISAVNEEIYRCDRLIEESLANGLQELVRMNLIIPVADLVALPQELVLREWNTNVVVAPEDRVDPRYADRGVHENHEYFGHAMAAIATSAGIWSNLGDPIGLLETVQGSQNGVVRVVRSFTRALFGDDVTGLIAEGVIAGLSDLSLVSAWRGIEVEVNTRLAVVRSVERILIENGSVFGFVDPPRTVQRQQVRTSGFGAVIDLCRFMWSRITGAPDRLFNRMRDRVLSKYESVIQAATYGKDSVYVVKVGNREIPPDLPDVEIADTAQMVLERIGLETPAGATAAQWDALRRSMLDLIDPETAGSRHDRMIADADSVVRAQVREPIIPESIPTGICDELLWLYRSTVNAADPLGTAALRELLVEQINVKREERRSAKAELDLLKSQRSLTMPRTTPQSGFTARSDQKSADQADSAQPVRRRWWQLRRKPRASDVTANVVEPAPTTKSDEGVVTPKESERQTENATTPSSGEQQTGQQPIDEGAEISENSTTASGEQGRGAIETAEELVRTLDATIERLESDLVGIDRWVEDQRSSAVWRIGEHIETDLRKAYAEFKKCLEAIIAGKPQTEPEIDDKATKRIKRSGIGAGLAAVGGIIGAILSTIWFVITIPVAIVSWAVYSVFEMWSLFQSLNRLGREKSEYESAIDRLPQVSAEVIKLQTTYRQFIEWADLLASMLHPCIRPPAPTAELELDVVARPAACQFIEVESNQQGRAGAVSRTGRALFATGWTDRIYARELDIATHTLSTELGLDPATIDSTPFSGVHQGRLRALMTTAFADGSAIERWRAEALETVVSVIGSESIADLFPIVEMDGVTQTAPEFFEVLEPSKSPGEEALFGIAHWAPTGLVEGATKIEKSFVSGPKALRDPMDGADYIALMSRLDVSGVLYDSRLKVFPRVATSRLVDDRIDPNGLG
ncbi:MAG: hypothetical protein WCJ88_10190 [Actinomycetes bacterium]